MSTKNLIQHGSGLLTAVDILKPSSSNIQPYLQILKNHMDSLGAIFQQIMEAPEKLPDPRIFQQQLTRCEEIFKKVVQETASGTEKSHNKNDKEKKHRKKTTTNNSSSENKTETETKSLVMKKAGKTKHITWSLPDLGNKKPASRDSPPAVDYTCLPCKFYVRGYCKHGIKCRYSHDFSKYIYAPSNNQPRYQNRHHYNHNNYLHHNNNRASSPPISPPNLYPSHNITPKFNNNPYASLFSDHNTPPIHPPSFSFPLPFFNKNDNHNIQQFSHRKPNSYPSSPTNSR